MGLVEALQCGASRRKLSPAAEAPGNEGGALLRRVGRNRPQECDGLILRRRPRPPAPSEPPAVPYLHYVNNGLNVLINRC